MLAYKRHWIWWSKDVGIRQIKLASMKMKTCHFGRILQQQIRALLYKFENGRSNYAMHSVWALVQQLMF